MKHLFLFILFLSAGVAAPAADGVLRVAVFEGAGAGGRGISAVGAIMDRLVDIEYEKVSAEAIRSGALSDFDIVAFTGGSGSRQADSLEAAGQQADIEFVENGGNYIGICAGAYLASDRRERYLGMLPYKHYLPWRLGGGYVEMDFTETGREVLGAPGDGTVRVRYNNGPIFVDADGNIPDLEAAGFDVLAHFRTAVREGSEVMVDMPAIIGGSHGNGRFVLVSPHPETAGDDYAHWIIENALRHLGPASTARGETMAGRDN